MKSLSLSKPLSSPSRPDKFPPPLMRFLRSNAASKSSRARSRSSPIFHLRTYKKRPPTTLIESTQEPSSPKVTCIGQVRVRRRHNLRRRRRWWVLQKPIFRGKIRSIFQNPKKPHMKVFANWVLCFRSNCCGERGNSDDKSEKIESFVACCDNFNNNNNKCEENVVEILEPSSSSPSPPINWVLRFRSNCCGEGGNSDQKCEKIESFVAVDDNRNRVGSNFNDKCEENKSCSSSSPPKNALLLTRCRSAPYRSSSLGGRFWAENGEIINNEGEIEGKKLEDLQNKAICENVVEYRDEVLEKKIEGLKVHPLVLTRCKSEPARKGERLIVNQESNFLLQRRLDVDNS